MQELHRSMFEFAVASAVQATLLGAVALASGAVWAQNMVSPQGGAIAPHARPLALPSFKVASSPGKALASSDLRGRVTVLNIWATWCGPCLRELPTLDRLQQNLGDKVRVLAVSQDEAGEKVAGPYLTRLGARHVEVHYDTKGELGSVFRARVLPLTVIVDKEGRERARYVGELDWSAAAAVRFVSQLVEE